MAVLGIGDYLCEACKHFDSDGLDGMTGIGRKNAVERLDRQLQVGMQLNADSVLGVIDSLQTNGYLPLPIAVPFGYFPFSEL